ncbi:fungal protein [Schizosaccharomyces japonicus yFS275]|uniref:Fungal protein n=1 Tax=Schizosaccharomyces japonicus (strain yFS275 / FY16936) TaxID=402676 RepID=B6JWH5_SCHJY|nr:fungal protein [Schizosaccharomyces japonicus yFS275]EEB05726.1 fungal protein [Schizosaccharomyces japonicus yFS275]
MVLLYPVVLLLCTVAPAFAGWIETHMQEEHHLDSFTDEYFFKVHDLGRKGFWDDKDILTLYGLLENDDVPFETKNDVLVDVLKRCDAGQQDRKVTMEEFVSFRQHGGELKDWGFPGHHGDEEEEFEMHHVEKYHPNPDEPEENWNHAEDIEHFQKHEEMYHSGKPVEDRRVHFLKPNNIPNKYKA